MLSNKIKIGIIGCGTIGSKLAGIIEKEITEMEICALCDLQEDRALKLLKEFNRDIKIMSIENLTDKMDIVIEAASSNISAKIVRMSLDKGKKVLALSVGGLLKDFTAIQKLARTKGGSLYIPSGAVSGIDGLKAVSASKVEYVTLTTKKPVKGIKDAPFIIKNNIDLNSIKTDTLIFSGKVEEAVEAFPQNINVAASIVLSGINSSLITVRIVTSPHFNSNTHEIKAKGEFGQITCTCENLPDPDNPKTSYLAILSAGAALKQIINPIKIGT